MDYSRFIEPQERYKAFFLLVFSFAFFLVGAILFSDTQLAVRLSKRADLEEIRRNIVRDKIFQDEIRHDSQISGLSPEQGITFKVFGPEQLSMLERAKNSLLQDDQLQKELQAIYGTNFNEVNAVVVPGWPLSDSYNTAQLGLTAVSWKDSRRAAGENNIPGFTIREQKPISERLTLTGTSVIGVNLAAFDDYRKAKLTLFHELLHAMNINGNQSTFYIVQNDLTFLPHYCDYVRRNGLEGRRQLWLWIGLGVIWGMAATFLFWPCNGTNAWRLLHQWLNSFSGLMRRNSQSTTTPSSPHREKTS